MENMVALVVFSVAIIFLYNMLFSGRMLVETGGERRMALKLTELKIEELRGAGEFLRPNFVLGWIVTKYADELSRPSFGD